MTLDCMLESFEGFTCRDASGSGASSSAGDSAGYAVLNKCFDTKKATAAFLSQFSQNGNYLSFIPSVPSLLALLLIWHICNR